MSISKTALLTLAALSAQSFTTEAKATPHINPDSQLTVPETSNFSDHIIVSSLPSMGSISRPEMFVSQAPDNPKIMASFSTPNLNQIRGVLNNSWLGKILAVTAENSPQVREVANQIALRSDADEASLDLNPTLTLLNTLLLVATLLPPVTVGFFWLVRRLVIKELVGEVNKRLT